MKLGSWRVKTVRDRFKAGNVPAFSGISGGRTSGMMAALHDAKVVLTFQNTGREHPKTYEFLDRLDHALGRRLVLLEFRPPKVRGARPREFEFEVVTHKTPTGDSRAWKKINRP